MQIYDQTDLELSQLTLVIRPCKVPPDLLRVWQTRFSQQYQNQENDYNHEERRVNKPSVFFDCVNDPSWLSPLISSFLCVPCLLVGYVDIGF